MRDETGQMNEPSRRTRVTVVGSGPPARGGIPSCIALLTEDHFFPDDVVVSLVNTTTAETRTSGRLDLTNLRSAIRDSVRSVRASRRSDVVHVHVAPGRPLPLARAVAMCTAARLGGAGVICHVHSARLNGGRPEEIHPGRVYRWLIRRLAVSHALVTVSDAGTRLLRSLVPGIEVTTIDNAVDVASFDRADVERQPPVVLFVGTLSQRKGLFDLLEATLILHRRGVTDWTLRIVGGPNEVGEEEAEAIVDAYCAEGLGESMLGSLDSAEVRRQLAAASIFVLPSYAEGQPIAILEAMASGLPVVSTTVGAIPDVVVLGESGLLTEPGSPADLANALERLITDPDMRRRLGEQARERATSHHDVAVLSGRLVALYRRCARSRR